MLSRPCSRLIDLRKGHPKPANLPHQWLAKAARLAASRLDDTNEDSFRLGYSIGSFGSAHFLDSLARFLTESYSSSVHGGALLTTNGVSHGLDLACNALTQPGDVIWMESPSYFLAHRIFRDHHLTVRSVPSDAYGLDCEALAEALASGSLGPPPKLLYLVPSHGNPSGATLPFARRQALVDLARKYSFIALADDVYHLLDWSQNSNPPPRLLAFDPAFQRHLAVAQAAAKTEEKTLQRPSRDAAATASIFAKVCEDDDDSSYIDSSASGEGGGGFSSVTTPEDKGCVVSIGSFTKILAPGLRVGWLEAAPTLLERISSRGYLTSGGSVAPFASDIVAELLDAGDQQEVLKALKADYQRSAAAMCAAVSGTRCLELATVPDGGYFAWVRLPEGIRATELLPVAERHGVVFLPGPVCAPACPAETWQSHVRLCFAWEDVAEIEEGVHRLELAVNEMLQVNSGRLVGRGEAAEHACEDDAARAGKSDEVRVEDVPPPRRQKLK
jgi:DNA-binding transcriptional MocR family regulator